MNGSLDTYAFCMTNLRSLCLGEWDVARDQLDQLSGLKQLTNLEISQYSPYYDGGTSCPWLSRMTHLHQLALRNSQLVDEGTIAGVACLEHLASLELCIDQGDPDELRCLSALSNLTRLQLHGRMSIHNEQEVGSILMPLSGIPLRVLQVWHDEEEYFEEGRAGDYQRASKAEHLTATAMAGLLPAHMHRALVNGGLGHDMGGHAHLRL